MKKYSVIFVLLFFNLAVKSYFVSLLNNGNNQMNLQWDLNYTTSSINMTIEVRNIMLGGSYSFGFGFSDDENMGDGDLIVVRVTRTSVAIKDCWLYTNGKVVEDSKHSYKLLGYQYSNGVWNIKVERKFQTCDGEDYQLDNGTTNVFVVFPIPNNCILSINGNGCNLSEATKTLTRVQLLKADYRDIPLEPNHKSFSIIAPNITIPTSQTSYVCSIQKLPKFRTKVHAIGFESVIANPGLVHHIEVFIHVVAAWAFGADPFYYPREAGMAFGVKTASSYVRLEVHYNNPMHIRGLVDGSGIRFHFTENLRPHDLGIMEVGVIYSANMAIPPGQKSFKWSGECPGSCTQAVITYELRLFIHIFQGDSLITTCTFNTENRSNITLGGLGLHEEMCVDYIYYYPATNLEVCKSSISSQALEMYFKLIKLSLGIPRPRNSRPLHHEYDVIKWGNSAVRSLRQLYRFAPMQVNCLRSNGESYPGRWDNITPATHFPRAMEPQCYANNKP
uniref:dopamine beta-hydroxylase-like n=1 Tax=Ciona intestinalis TaxID=7719 RepID=UPI000EF464A5|nr:dopamine beta-hydroxylase-like [Ciona intestinalis]|eukprot:XP_026695728.1 dopamine beta-hydroxylase-like [Ciona intestinalis]